MCKNSLPSTSLSSHQTRSGNGCTLGVICGRQNVNSTTSGSLVLALSEQTNPISSSCKSSAQFCSHLIAVYCGSCAAPIAVPDLEALSQSREVKPSHLKATPALHGELLKLINLAYKMRRLTRMETPDFPRPSTVIAEPRPRNASAGTHTSRTAPRKCENLQSHAQASSLYFYTQTLLLSKTRLERNILFEANGLTHHVVPILPGHRLHHQRQNRNHQGNTPSFLSYHTL